MKLWNFKMCVYEWSLFTCWKEIYIYVEKCLWLFYRWLRSQSLSLSKLLEKCVSNFMKIVNCKMNCKMNCKTIYISFLLMSSCLLCSDNAFNLALLLNDDFFLKLVISKLRLRVETELNFKEEVILRCSFFTAKDDDLDSSFNLETVTNFIKFLWFTIFYNDWSSFFNLFLSVKCDVTRSKWADAENRAFESEVVVDLAVLSNVDNVSSLKFENLNCKDVMKRLTLIESSFFSSDIVN